MSMSKASKAKQLTLFDCREPRGTYRSIKCNFLFKTKIHKSKSTNKSSSDDTGIAGTSLEVEVNFS